MAGKPPFIIRFWGVRGTLPVPGKKTVRYGGNTNCVTLESGRHFFIFDAGTGIRVLSDWLLQTKQKNKKKKPVFAKIFISHPHYDHINGLPFFRPLYMKENAFEIFGGEHGGHDIATLIAGQMDQVYFPVTISEFQAELRFRTLSEESFAIGDCRIQTIRLNHPGGCLGYRVQCGKKIFCYVTDNELLPQNSRDFDANAVDRLVVFLQDADLAVMDATYTDEEYIDKAGWGHSALSRTVMLAARARVKKLCLYHHDPGQLDRDIDKKLREARKILKAQRSATRCIAACEGAKVVL